MSGARRTLQIALRVRDGDASLGFYEALGYEVVGRVPDAPIGSLTMLKLPDDDYVSLELVEVEEAGSPGDRLSHLAIQVVGLRELAAALSAKGIEVGEVSSPDGSSEFLTATVSDPDGNRVELVQWPAGHAAGLTADDWSP